MGSETGGVRAVVVAEEVVGAAGAAAGQGHHLTRAPVGVSGGRESPAVKIETGGP